ncbi:MAG: 1-acyl-sn-glycerol-3-phosphate acyltransferase [Clostridia bacterium]|nr:1-acyl-sn-glycerol-3-phosphate acyltransferase [Clostridia bacterium]MBQ3221964.1 1-acyl-sn-glycerol-3-phosphate acyltransferase [Clostridia bacterium]
MATLLEQEYKVPSKKQPVYRWFRPVMRLIFKKPQIINLAGELPEKSIILANHSAKSGPPSLDLYYPVFCAKWGAYQMFGDFQSRKAYLRDILYIKKCGKKPGFFTSLKSTIMAIFSPYIYKGMKMMPTFPDARFAKTLRNSAKVLDAGMSVMVFPENSNDGYKDVLTDFFPGFVMLAEKYYRATGEDVPVYPVYYSVKKHLLVIGKPLQVQEFVKQGLDRYQIAQKFCEAVNQLYFDHVENE